MEFKTPVSVPPCKVRYSVKDPRHANGHACSFRFGLHLAAQTINLRSSLAIGMFFYQLFIFRTGVNMFRLSGIVKVDPIPDFAPLKAEDCPPTPEMLRQNQQKSAAITKIINMDTRFTYFHGALEALTIALFAGGYLGLPQCVAVLFMDFQQECRRAAHTNELVKKVLA